MKRICTWVRLHDQVSGRTLRIYNTHQYLTERARLPAVAITPGPRQGRRPVRRDLARGRLQRHPGGTEPAVGLRAFIFFFSSAKERGSEPLRPP